MATSPPANLPLFYKNLQPLTSAVHGKLKAKNTDKAPYLADTHAVPVTIDEFTIAQRFYPIVFSAGQNSVPLALMGLNEGVNVFIDEEGKPHNPVYIPAYVRRYPYILARIDPSKDELTLCYDPESDLVGELGEGQPLFDGDQASETLSGILKFCEEFEVSAQRTNAFMKELEDARAADRRRGFGSARGRAAAVRLSRLQDGRRAEAPRHERRPAQEDQPERHPAADHGPPLLADPHPRDFRPPAAAGQGARAAGPGARPGRRLRH